MKQESLQEKGNVLYKNIARRVFQKRIGMESVIWNLVVDLQQHWKLKKLLYNQPWGDGPEQVFLQETLVETSFSPKDDPNILSHRLMSLPTYIRVTIRGHHADTWGGETALTSETKKLEISFC